ncbi:DUF3800 domain-containing protein [Burkholderia lata]|uniref:DUF3800 domain-containing protein n=1 Tax=Burkholderia lata (strain ATCC 17760 / DSM 23089 / LMG 22485 / NCIMB 9086 / R18194 / 383) TaxID=482957 RepID=UPI00399A7047
MSRTRRARLLQKARSQPRQRAEVCRDEWERASPFFELARQRARQESRRLVHRDNRPQEHANDAFRRHPNRLYNFMAKYLLLETMSNYDAVSFIPDARSIKVESKHALHDYLATELASISNTTLHTTPWESKDSFALQFVDVMAGIIWSNYEFGKTDAYGIAVPYIGQKHLISR